MHRSGPKLTEQKAINWVLVQAERGREIPERDFSKFGFNFGTITKTTGIKPLKLALIFRYYFNIKFELQFQKS